MLIWLGNGALARVLSDANVVLRDDAEVAGPSVVVTYKEGVLLMDQWKAANGRITLFPASPFSATTSSVVAAYRSVWGADPDSFQAQPNALQPSVAQGKGSAFTRQLLFHPGRIDFNLNPIPTQMTQPGGMPLALIEDTKALHDELARMAKALAQANSFPANSRVALWIQFLCEKVSVVEVNRKILEAMPEAYRPKITDEHDLIFQLNRPRSSATVQNVRMNFITKWSSERFQVVELAFSSGVAVSQEHNLQVKDFLAASLSFDNNNVPDPNQQLTSNEQSLLLLEALSAVEIQLHELKVEIEGF